MIKAFRKFFFAVVDILKEVNKDKKQSRYLYRWFTSLIHKNNSLEYELPWLTYESIDSIEKYLSKEMNVFEWGSGSSTIFFAKRVKRIISIEHDYDWYKKVTNHLRSKKLNKNAKVIYKKPIKIMSNKKRANEEQEDYKNYSFKGYSSAINKYPDRYFDLILVDGRARINCIKLATKKIKKGGWIVFDNADADKYSKGIININSLDRLNFKGIGSFNSYSWLTTIFTM